MPPVAVVVRVEGETMDRLPDQETCQVWANILNKWYEMNTGPAEVLEAFKLAFKDREAFPGEDETRPYIDVFLLDANGEFHTSLDTADREDLSYAIDKLRKAKHKKATGIPLKCECGEVRFYWHTRGKVGMELVCYKCEKLYLLSIETVNGDQILSVES